MLRKVSKLFCKHTTVCLWNLETLPEKSSNIFQDLCSSLHSLHFNFYPTVKHHLVEIVSTRVHSFESVLVLMFDKLISMVPNNTYHFLLGCSTSGSCAKCQIPDWFRSKYHPGILFMGTLPGSHTFWVAFSRSFCVKVQGNEGKNNFWVVIVYS